MSSTSARWDKIDQRQDPVIFCQSLASVQWPLVTIRVLCTACASMSKCTCLLLTLNPHGELAGSSQHLMSIHVYLIFLPRRGRTLPGSATCQTGERSSRIGRKKMGCSCTVLRFLLLCHHKKVHPWPVWVWNEKRRHLSKTCIARGLQLHKGSAEINIWIILNPVTSWCVLTSRLWPLFAAL